MKGYVITVPGKITKYKRQKKKSYPRYRPWRPIGLFDTEDPTLSRQSAHR
jgi:hypothetical protein